LGKTKINRPGHVSGREGGDRARTDPSATDNAAQMTAVTTSEKSTNPPLENLFEKPHNRTAPLLKMSTPPVHFEHPPLYITNTTSEKTSLNAESSAPSTSSLTGMQREKTPNSFEEKNEQLPSIESTGGNETQLYSLTEDTPHYPKAMIKLWNEIIEGEPNKISLTTQRSRYLNTASKQFFKGDLAEWEAFCLKIASSKFLMGEVNPFKAHLDWAIRFDVIQKILEGAYTFGDRFVSYTSTLKPTNISADGDESFTTERNPEKKTGERAGEEEPDWIHAIRCKINAQIGNAHYRSWFLNTRIGFESSQKKDEQSSQKPVLYVGSMFVRDRIQTQYRDIVDAYFSYVCVGEPKRTVPIMAHETESQKMCEKMGPSQKKLILLKTEIEQNDPINIEQKPTSIPHTEKNLSVPEREGFLEKYWKKTFFEHGWNRVAEIGKIPDTFVSMCPESQPFLEIIGEDRPLIQQHEYEEEKFNNTVLNPEWAEFPAACGATRVDPLDTPQLAAARSIRANTKKTRFCDHAHDLTKPEDYIIGPPHSMVYNACYFIQGIKTLHTNANIGAGIIDPGDEDLLCDFNTRIQTRFLRACEIYKGIVILSTFLFSTHYVKKSDSLCTKSIKQQHVLNTLKDQRYVVIDDPPFIDITHFICRMIKSIRIRTFALFRLGYRQWWFNWVQKTPIQKIMGWYSSFLNNGISVLFIK
jgi:hypothetical protein